MGSVFRLMVDTTARASCAPPTSGGEEVGSVLLELTMAEQRFNAVMEVLRDGLAFGLIGGARDRVTPFDNHASLIILHSLRRRDGWYPERSGVVSGRSAELAGGQGRKHHREGDDPRGGLEDRRQHWAGEQQPAQSVGGDADRVDGVL